ncbi:MAG: hypothetical protein WBG71_02430 [Leeuwenhoekiella sp.]
MKRIVFICLLGLLTLGLISCRESTQDKTEEAAKAIGNDIEEGTERAVKETGDAIKKGADELNDEIQGNDDL